MQPRPIKAAERLFERLADLRPEQRDPILNEACRHDAELRAFVERLLANHDAGMGDFLCKPVFKPECATTEEPAVVLPQGIGRYAIVRLIGEGGMGTVYEARQENPHRTVALKVVKPALASPGLLKRFRREAQLLGQLHHPGIAHIYEAGVAPVGAEAGFSIRRPASEQPGLAQDLPQPAERPYLAMEYIDGVWLTDYAARHGLGARQRMELVAKVCDAVHHAHEQGIVHRDLKPGNILVDASGQPKVLDFGVARATDADIQTMTLQTDVGQLVGTLAYMSPEQVSGDSKRLDARSDVYAIGVILYQLLGDRLPYDVVDRSIPEAARIIRDQEPTRLSSIHSTLRGDVETMVAKALEKDPQRRYPSAGELAADIRRYLHDQPILARPASRMYQLRKFATRHKGLMAGVTMTFIALILGLIGTTVAMLGASAQRDEAILASDEAQQARAAEAEQRAAAEVHATRAASEAAKAEAVNRFLQDMLVSASPIHAKSPEVKVRDLLEEAGRQIEAGELRDQPLIEAAVRSTLGEAYRNLGLYEDAGRHLETALEARRRVLGEEHEEVALSLSALGELFLADGEYARAESMFREALAMRRRLWGQQHPDVASSMTQLALALKERGEYAAAEPLYREALAMRRSLLEPGHAQIAQTLNDLGGLMHARRELNESEALHREALEIRRRSLDPDSLDLAQSLNNLGNVLHHKGKLPEAEVMYREALEVRRRRLGDQHPLIAYSLNNLGTVLRDQGRWDAAEPLLRQALAIRRELLGDQHPHVAVSIANLATLLQLRGDHADAEPLLRDALAIAERAHGPDHVNVAIAMNKLADTLSALGEDQQAVELSRRALSVVRQALGDDNPMVASNMHNLAMLLNSTGEHGSAEQLAEHALSIFRKRLGEADPHIAHCMGSLGVILADQGRHEEAESLLREVLARRRRMLKSDHPLLAQTLHQLGSVVFTLGQGDQAEPLVREALEIRRRALPSSHRDLGKSLVLLGRILCQSAGPAALEEAELLLREGLAVQQAALPEGDVQMTETRRLLEACRTAPPPQHTGDGPPQDD